MFVDTHCHLTFPQFDADRAMVIGNAKKVGVKQFIIPGSNIGSSYKAVSFAQSFKAQPQPQAPSVAKALADRQHEAGPCFAAIGCHPYEASDKPNMQALEKLLGPKVIAIGECGLDYHLFKGFPAEGKKTEQKLLFEEHLRLTLKHNLPVIVHCRDAFEDIFDVLDSLPSMPKGVFHCFAGGVHDVKEVEKRGFYFGIDGNVTYSKQLALTVPLIPLDKLLLETDAPYLPPIPYRGERCEPKYIPLIAKKIAELKQCTIKQVQDLTTKNAHTLFGIHIAEEKL
jgi:TatD DNase family protein